MKSTLPTFFVIGFAIAAVAITIAASDNSNLYNYIKPTLMPLLAMALLATKKNNISIVITGLVFSWAGDVLLMYDYKSPMYFIGGLTCFLITHVCYIIYFLKIKSAAVSLLRNQPWIAALVAGYGVSLILFLFPHLGGMKIPVMLYAVVICTMLMCSLQVFTKVNRPANILFVAGALLFAASDSLLAINKFYKPFNHAGDLIISTYCAAQLCIAVGAMKRAA